MKVLQIINSLGAGGAEKLIVDSIIRYSRKGIKVSLLLLDGHQTPLLDIVKSNPAIELIILDTQRSVYHPIFIFKIRKILKNFDIVHVHLFPSQYWVSLAKRIGNKKTKIIFTEHNTTNRRRKLYVFKILDRIIYRSFDKVISISDAVHDNLQLHLGDNFKNIYKIYNGIDLKIIDDAKPYTKQELGFVDQHKLVIQVSSFTIQKDQKTLIRSLTKLDNDVHIILVGDGVTRNEHEELCTELKLENRVHFFGLRKDVPRLLKTADIVVLSSHYEGLSLSSVEGLASGKPFISSDVPGLTEVVEGAGLLFTNTNSDELASIISKLLSDHVYYLKISKSCSERASNFDIEDMVANYIDIYNELNNV